MKTVSDSTQQLDELVTMRELQRELSSFFPSEGSLEWEVRRHRSEYVAGGALFAVAGRLLVHPPTFKRVALEIGARKLAQRTSAA